MVPSVGSTNENIAAGSRRGKCMAEGNLHGVTAAPLKGCTSRKKSTALVFSPGRTGQKSSGLGATASNMVYAPWWHPRGPNERGCGSMVSSRDGFLMTHSNLQRTPLL